VKQVAEYLPRKFLRTVRCPECEGMGGKDVIINGDENDTQPKDCNICLGEGWISEALAGYLGHFDLINESLRR